MWTNIDAFTKFSSIHQTLKFIIRVKLFLWMITKLFADAEMLGKSDKAHYRLIEGWSLHQMLTLSSWRESSIESIDCSLKIWLIPLEHLCRSALQMNGVKEHSLLEKKKQLALPSTVLDECLGKRDCGKFDRKTFRGRRCCWLRTYFNNSLLRQQARLADLRTQILNFDQSRKGPDCKTPEWTKDGACRGYMSRAQGDESDFGHI